MGASGVTLFMETRDDVWWTDPEAARSRWSPALAQYLEVFGCHLKINQSSKKLI
jgi:hypothetical protein